MKDGLYLLALGLMNFGCSASCYTLADAEAAQAYVTECEGYEDTHKCPEGDRIDAEHEQAYQECKR